MKLPKTTLLGGLALAGITLAGVMVFSDAGVRDVSAGMTPTVTPTAGAVEYQRSAEDPDDAPSNTPDESEAGYKPGEETS